MRRSIAVFVISSAVAASASFASGPIARGEGMGGSYSAFASGAEGMWWNPAVLGSQLLFSANLGGGIEGGNNALTIWDVAQLAMDPAGSRTDLLGKIPATGWSADVRGAGGIAAAASLPMLGTLGVGVFQHQIVTADKISKDAIDFALGYDPANQASSYATALVSGQTYDFSGKFASASVAEIGVGYAKDVPEPMPGLGLTAGGTVKYLYGMKYLAASLNEQVSLLSGVTGDPVTYDDASSGSGVGVDLGAHAKFMGMAKAAVVVKNIGAKMTWKADRYENRLAITGSSVGLQATKTSAKPTMTLPLELRVGVGGTVPLVGTSLGVEYAGDLTNKRNRVRIGGEQSLLGILAARVGYVTKAEPYDAQVTAGVGIGALIAGLDIAAGFPMGGGGAKGGSVALSAYLSF